MMVNIVLSSTESLDGRQRLLKLLLLSQERHVHAKLLGGWARACRESLVVGPLDQPFGENQHLGGSALAHLGRAAWEQADVE